MINCGEVLATLTILLYFFLKEGRYYLTLFLTPYQKIFKLENEFLGVVNSNYGSYFTNECSTSRKLTSELMNVSTFQNVVKELDVDQSTINTDSKFSTFLYKLLSK